MAIHQISVFLENRAGQLAEITALLAKNNIDLRAINIAETSDYGVLRLIASHEPEACRVLRENGFIFSASEVVAVGVPDEPRQVWKYGSGLFAVCCIILTVPAPPDSGTPQARLLHHPKQRL